MSVKFILNRVGKKMGLNPSDTDQRDTLLRFLNEAAVELYDQSDMPNSLMEQVFKVNGDQTITCPSYVGEIRALRELDSQLAWSITQMRPRYNQFNWKDMWRNIRLKNVGPLQKTVTNQSVGVITVPAVETPNITVTVSGPTNNATNATEDVVINATSVQTVNQYLDYTSVTKNTINKYDVTLSDVDGNILTVLPNNEFEALYQTIDVSQCPWLQVSTSTLDHYLEILYKKKLAILFNDSDEFPAPQYDDILVLKILQLWGEEQGKPDVATAYDTKATRSLARRTENRNRATEDEIALVSNPHDSLLPRIRQGRRNYRRGWGSRGFFGQ